MDIEQRLKNDYYQKLVTVPYSVDRKEHQMQVSAMTRKFCQDCVEYTIECKVPEKYAQKVVELAWDQGHAYGYAEVLSKLEDLIGIFN